jgi:hypothetical protein
MAANLPSRSGRNYRLLARLMAATCRMSELLQSAHSLLDSSSFAVHDLFRMHLVR